MSVIHFDPYGIEDDFDTKTSCGVTYIDFDPNGSTSWIKVTCKRCLKMKARLQLNYEKEENNILQI